MNTKKMLFAGGLAVAALVVFTQVKKLATPAPVQVPDAVPVVEVIANVEVVFAKADIPFGSRIKRDQIGWGQWPADASMEGYILKEPGQEQSAIEELVGNVARAPMYKGEPVSTKKLVRPGDQGLMAALIKPGMRAVTIRISVDTAAGGFIQPGDRVDIILTTDVPQAAQVPGGKRTNYVANTIFDNVHVLAIDQTYTSSAEGGAAVLGSTATFELSQSDAELLQQITAEGDISLTLRGIEGNRSYAPSAARMNRNSGQISTLTVYRGGQPTQVAIKGK